MLCPNYLNLLLTFLIYLYHLKVFLYIFLVLDFLLNFALVLLRCLYRQLIPLLLLLVKFLPMDFCWNPLQNLEYETSLLFHLTIDLGKDYFEYMYRFLKLIPLEVYHLCNLYTCWLIQQNLPLGFHIFLQICLLIPLVLIIQFLLYLRF